MARPNLYKCRTRNKTYAVPVDHFEEIDAAMRKVLSKYLIKPVKK